jgi:hypothetical protein
MWRDWLVALALAVAGTLLLLLTWMFIRSLLP